MTTVEALLVAAGPPTRPPRLLFVLCNPLRAMADAWIPLELGPPGHGVHLRVLDSAGEEVWATPPVKAKSKLHPDRPRSYRSLSPGQVQGLLVDLGEADLAPGTYTAVASYDNRDFTGTAERPVGRLELTARTSFEVAGG